MNATLTEILRASEAILAEGAADPGSVWRTPTLATMGGGQVPQARTVVLRRYDAGLRCLEIHTDTRSAKFGEMAAWPAAGLHGWDAARQIQLRLTGRVTLRTGPDADAAWAALRPQSRATYQVRPGPGTVIDAPAGAGAGSEADARRMFCVIALDYDTLEYLNLGRDGHRRASFVWQAGACSARWLVP